MNKQWADEIVRTNVASLIAVSLDSGNPEIYQRIRGGANLEILKRNLDYMEEQRVKRGRRNPKWEFYIALSDLSVATITETLQFIRNYDVSEIAFQPLLHNGYDNSFFTEHNIFQEKHRGVCRQFRMLLEQIEIPFPSNKKEICKLIDRHLDPQPY